MRRLIVLLLLAGSAWAQFSEVALTSPAPNPPERVSASRSGAAGPLLRCYWVVAIYPIGKSAPRGGACVEDSATTLTGLNYNRINWTAAAGATGYDVIRTLTYEWPVNCTGCVVVANTALLTVNDNGGVLGNYTGTTARAANAAIRINNRDFATPKLESTIPWDSSNGGAGVQSGAALPGACSKGDLYNVLTVDPPLTLCTSTNTWRTVQVAGDPTKDGAAGYGTAGGTHTAWWVAPFTDLAADTAFSMPGIPSADSLWILKAPTNRVGRMDTNVPASTVEASLASLVTTVGSPGTDTNIPTEKAVRDAISAIPGGGGGGISSTQNVAASVPATCTVGDLFFMTNGLYSQLRCSALNTWSYFVDGGKLVTPPAGVWAWDHNPGLGGATATVDTTRKSWIIKATKDLGNATDISAYYSTAPAAPYTRTFVVRPNYASSPTGAQGWYIGFGESGTGRMVLFGAESPNGDGYRGKYGTTKFTSTTNLTPGWDVSNQMPGGQDFFTGWVWVRLTDDNATITFELSFDGISYNSIQNVSRTAFMAGGPDRLIIGVRNAGGGIGDMFLNIAGIQ